MKHPQVQFCKTGVVTQCRQVGKLDQVLFVQQKLEVIGALSKLGEELSEAEKDFFENNSDKSLKQFSTVSETVVIKDGLGLTK